MSHVKRKPSRYPGRIVRKKRTKKKWKLIFLLSLFFMGLLIGIIFLLLTTPF